MAKKIFPTEAEVNEFLRSAQAQLIEESRQLKNKKFQGDQSEGVTLNFKLKEVKDDRKANIIFTETAWIKIFALVHSYSTEVEWHGVVKRTAPDTFLIEDILVFPHEVTGSTVTSDQKAYEEWLDGLDNNTFNALRFHGHSHVNMGVTPSTVDMTYRRNILNNFGMPSAKSDYFYIFLIFNKKGDISGEVYDLQNNALYSTDEINILHESAGWLTKFLDEAKELVKEKTYSYNSGGYSGGNYGGGSHYGGSYGNTAAAQTTPATTTKSPKIGAKQEARQLSALDDDAPDPLDDDYYSGVYGYGRYGGR